MIREPAVAGLFYPDDPQQIEEMIAPWLSAEPELTCTALMVPHAGYLYSGAIAARGLSRVRIPRRVLMLGPNHRGGGPAVSLYARGAWRSPLGEMPIDEALARSVLERSALCRDDVSAHLREHSLEVQLPLLQKIRPDTRILPLSLSALSLDQILDLARSLHTALIEPDDEPWLVLVSSDMSHFETASVAREKDMALLESICAMDVAGTLSLARERQISACGLTPILVAMEICRLCGHLQTQVLGYGHSGEVSGDMDRVVGYAAVALGIRA